MYKILLTVWFIINFMPAQTIIGSGNTKLNLFNHLIENYKTNNVELQLTVQSSVLSWIIYFIKFQKDIYDILNIDDKEGILSYEIYKNHGVYKLYLSMTNKNVLIDKRDYKYVCRSVSKEDDYEYILPFEIIIYKVL